MVPWSLIQMLAHCCLPRVWSKNSLGKRWVFQIMHVHWSCHSQKCQLDRGSSEIWNFLPTPLKFSCARFQLGGAMAQNQSNWEADKMYELIGYLLYCHLLSSVTIKCWFNGLTLKFFSFGFIILPRLDVYIYDYLLKKKLNNTAKSFMTEGKVSPDPVGKISICLCRNLCEFLFQCCFCLIAYWLHWAFVVLMPSIQMVVLLSGWQEWETW